MKLDFFELFGEEDAYRDFVDEFCHSDCWTLAAMLNEHYGWPIRVLRKDGFPVHAYNVLDGLGWIDMHGVHASEAEVNRHFPGIGGRSSFIDSTAEKVSLLGGRDDWVDQRALEAIETFILPALQKHFPEACPQERHLDLKF